MNAWSHLPNAAHIDRVLASVKAHPELWDRTIDQVWVQAWYQACRQARDQVWYQASRQARDQVWYQAWDQTQEQAREQARGALLALIVYDDCAKYLNLPIDQLQMLYHLTEHPACILLQTAVLVFAMEKERELVQG